MLPDPGPRFEREYGCSEAEWLTYMPSATHGHDWQRCGDRELRVALKPGRLRVCWSVLPPRVIALLRLPRLWVQFEFDDTPDDVRREFLRGFDLRLQRGGG